VSQRGGCGLRLHITRTAVRSYKCACKLTHMQFVAQTTVIGSLLVDACMHVLAVNVHTLRE
jgi:hypothetical protein